MSYTIPSEAQEAVAFVGFLRKFNLRFAHIPNETGIGGRAWFRVATKKKNEGMQKGFPDYLIFMKRGVIVVELKRRRAVLLSGKVGASPSAISKEQKEWVEFLGGLDYCNAYICFGADEAIARVKENLLYNKD